MAKKKVAKEYDENIIQALVKLSTPIIGKNGKEFYIRDDARYESGLEHIANKSHRLKVRDIQSVPSILKHPSFEIADPNNNNYRNYYGIRKGLNKNCSLLKIVTWPDENDPNKELVVTIYPTSSIKVEKTKKKRNQFNWFFLVYFKE